MAPFRTPRRRRGGVHQASEEKTHPSRWETQGARLAHSERELVGVKSCVEAALTHPSADTLEQGWDQGSPSGVRGPLPVPGRSSTALRILRQGTGNGSAHPCLGAQPPFHGENMAAHESPSFPHSRIPLPAASCRPCPNLCSFLLHGLRSGKVVFLPILASRLQDHNNLLVRLPASGSISVSISVSVAAACTYFQHNLPKQDAVWSALCSEALSASSLPTRDRR